VTVESLINQRTNKVISSLTVISVSLLPLTLLSGIYGMNIANLPFADNPKWVWMMFGGLALFIIGIIIAMKKKRWL
jgi:Mg2+ and Co2+ transporter CorA